MPIEKHTSVTVACDVCRTEWESSFIAGAPEHFADAAEARSALARSGWVITAAGIVLCDTSDAAHRAELVTLMPPEPVIQLPGQLDFGGEVSGSA